MAIGSAIERGSLIQVFDEHGRTLFSKARGVRARGRIAKAEEARYANSQ